MFKEVINEILFGVSNKDLCDEIFPLIDRAMELVFGPVEMLTFGLLTKIGWNP